MYSPKIKEDLIPILYRLKLRLDKPMTKIIDEIVRPELSEMAEIFLKEDQEDLNESGPTGKGIPQRVD